jgi:hypothetical protein
MKVKLVGKYVSRMKRLEKRVEDDEKRAEKKREKENGIKTKEEERKSWQC